MGVIISTLIRSSLYTIALVINIAASVTIVRKLDIRDYALYQTIMKRVVSYGALLPGLYGLWLYRYTVKGVRGAAAAGLLLSTVAGLITAIIGNIVATSLGAYPLTAILAGFAASLAVAWTGIRWIIDAVQPVRVAVAVLVQRILYSILIVVLIYHMRLGVDGAFVAMLISYLSAIILVLFWLRSRGIVEWPGLRYVANILTEWLRKIYVTALSSIATIIQALDVAIVYAFSNVDVVAAFFAIMNIFLLITEAAWSGFTYLHGFVLSTNDYESAINVIRITTLLASPFVIYIAIYPLHLVYLLNPKYSWASIIAPITAISSLALIANGGLQNLLAGLIRDTRGSERKLARLYSIDVFASMIYLILLTIGLWLSDTRQADIISWALAYLGYSVIFLFFLLIYMRNYVKNKFLYSSLVSSLVWGLFLYPGIAILTALMFPPLNAPLPRFWDTVEAITPSIIAAALTYSGLVLLIDKWARELFRTVLKKAL
ncbi:hypothetical protein [Pyrodictium abyssi]|uniref:Polysaccharide biosynthesis protein n=1 Tax=Pyrodictium abyssi TaxID=54256 RepID=A0ABM8J0K8_9CREN|nr:hypothetical protein PABY_19460 [Pyrodictium abyssi]